MNDHLVASYQAIENLYVAVKAVAAQLHRGQAGFAALELPDAATLGHLFDGGVRKQQPGLSCTGLHSYFGHFANAQSLGDTLERDLSDALFRDAVTHRLDARY